jgi:Tfp pilus assembly protein PilX
MMTPFPHLRSRGQRGTGLLIILTMVVLLSALIVMFLSWAMSQRQVSANSASQTKAELFARGALDIVVSGLQQEMANGSKTTTINGVTIYTPSNSTNIAPIESILTSTLTLTTPSAAAGNSLRMPTLIRESGRGESTTLPAYAVPSNASACNSTTTLSANGRNISLPRWNAHYLLQRANTSTNTPSSTYDDRMPLSSIAQGVYNPNTKNPGGFMPPDWVYVTKEEGPVVLNTPNVDASGNTVTTVGRYAYAIYDEGALLDVNAAGFPSNSGVTTQFATKGAIAFADLTQLGTGTMTQATINNLIGWRNYASMTAAGVGPSGSFPSYTFSGTAFTGTYVNIVRANATGFMTANNSISGGRTDQAILSRQELISLLMGTNSSTGTFNNFNPAALMYLGTFSRAVNAPSWGPQADASSILNGTVAGSSSNLYAYKTNANTSTTTPFSSSSPNPNRNIPNVRFSTAATITHYDDYGNPSTYSVTAGLSLVQRRFSLAKLAWIASNGPNTSAFNSSLTSTQQAAAIQACFGLSWNSTAYRWEYVGATGTATQNSIETLDQIGNSPSIDTSDSAQREPNFFELLKAGILYGSVGRDPGAGVDYVFPGVVGGGGIGVISSFYIPGTGNYRAAPDLHILQIGVNIIDQARNDSYPTAIHLQYWGTSASPLDAIDELAINTVYGEKNLPCLHAVVSVLLADPIPSGGGTTGTVSNPITPGKLYGWFTPYLWNPHQVPTGTLTPGGYPTEFRAHAYGAATTEWFPKVGPNKNTPQYNSTRTYYDDGTGNDASGGRGDIYFTNPADATSPFYAAPRALNLTLTTGSTGTGGTAIVDTTKTPQMNTYNQDPTNYHQDDVNSYTSTVTSVQFAGFSVAPDLNYAADPTQPASAANLDLYMQPDGVTPVTFSLQYLGPDGNYHPYNFWTRVALDNTRSKQFKMNDYQSVYGETQLVGWGPEKMDPRTDRFSASNCWWTWPNYPTTTMNPSNGAYIGPAGSGAGGAGDFCIPYIPTSSPFYYNPAYNPTVSATHSGAIEDWQRNDTTFTDTITIYTQTGTTTGTSTVAGDSYYADPDGVVRYGDGYRQLTGKIAQSNTAWSGDGSEMYLGTSAVTPASTIPLTASTDTWSKSTASPPGSAQDRRPIILNRPFRSVGEMGFAYRDLPFKTVDFWSATSGDAGLLDLFSVSDEPAVVAGQVDISNAPPAVLKAILSGVAKSDALSIQMAAADTGTIVGTAGDGNYDMEMSFGIPSGGTPLLNRSNLATSLGPLISDPYLHTVFTFQATPFTYANYANKAYAEAPMRALVDVTNTRTWNVMIDLVAQTGMFAPNSPATSAALGTSFIVQGEHHYWMHVAIDRFTGKVVDQKLEAVYEQ